MLMGWFFNERRKFLVGQKAQISWSSPQLPCTYDCINSMINANQTMVAICSRILFVSFAKIGTLYLFCYVVHFQHFHWMPPPKKSINKLLSCFTNEGAALYVNHSGNAQNSEDHETQYVNISARTNFGAAQKLLLNYQDALVVYRFYK